jgi:hypothetical protein
VACTDHPLTRFFCSLRSYLLDRGIVAPSNTREQLVVLA